MGKSIATNAGVMVYCRIYVERLCIFEVGNGEMGAQLLELDRRMSSARKYIECEECQHPQGCTARLWDSKRLAQIGRVFSEEGRPGNISEAESGSELL